jgi:phosphoenolpyruvate synthase/pyruvate phosphate dikinase
MSGKALNLTKLAEHGIAVPAGFYLDDSHYHDAVETIREDLLAGVLNGNPVRHLFETLPLPARTIRAIAEGISRVPSTSTLAVRSSGQIATDHILLKEDSTSVSLAGQFESFLNVASTDIADAVRLFWASLYNDRSVQLFHAERTYVEKSAMAVLIQEMVPAAASAVVMTVDPLADGSLGGIELTVGPCAAIVSGMVIPDEVLFDRTSGRITECRIGAKECAIEFSPFSRGSENAIKRPLPASVSKRLAVSDDTLAEIIHVAWRVEKVFDSPQDIELVINAEDVITIVQARSITRLPDNIMPFNRLTGHTIRSEETQNA